jgi:protocatechuate 3,4-dioxygenase beta subunit
MTCVVPSHRVHRRRNQSSPQYAYQASDGESDWGRDAGQDTCRHAWSESLTEVSWPLTLATQIYPHCAENKAMNSSAFTESVLQQYRFSDPRHTQLLGTLVRHLHAFIEEVCLTHDEWRMGLDFVTAAGRISDHKRNEFSLISDVLGISSLVDLLSSAPGATPGSVLGPFHVHDSKTLPNGADLKAEQAGSPTLLECQVLSVDGRPLQANVDFWQNADNGLYPQQDPEQDYQNLRCKLQTDDNGCFTLRTIMPKPYSIPDDGPVGALMRAAHRHNMRPAHFHIIVEASGHRRLTTELFFPGDTYLESDAVFGVRPQLITPVERVADAEVARRLGMPNPFGRVRYELRLAPSVSAH